MNEDDLSVYSFEARVGYQIVLWPIVLLGVAGNLTVLWRVSFGAGINSTLKPLYRSALFSMSLSDLLLLSTSGYNTLANMILTNILWVLPEWACTALPCLQTTAVLASSLTLAAVAVTRYRAMKPKYPPPAGPTLPLIIILFLMIWGISIAATYPVLGLYDVQSLIVVTDVTYYRAFMCVTKDRDKATITYVLLYAAIFLPLGIVFVGVHVLLALKIRGRRIKRGDKMNLGASSDSQFTETSTATTSTVRASSIVRKRSAVSPPFLPRKQRTVKVILWLIAIFTICRLPVWTFTVIKLYVRLSGTIWWHVQAIVTILSLVSTAANPFLYAFINEALSTVTWIKSWCCSGSNEANLSEHETPSAKFGSNVASIKVPRGPYAP
ncbi:galanin-like G-protein coupled receptor npr-9 [Athalia rosae]|uniref:galanin-like G-protein coupled receptor npr-9 n=1 Tax=Athalia rosae TaxID=37344 RepID=UPI0020339F0C|nr:galanin-like G-protein coupled receptor npr-9 [Athalia rosae]